MSRSETLKRSIILIWSLLGIGILTLIYMYTWLNFYHGHVVWNVKLYFRGHVLMAAVYLVLLVFFVTTFGGLKIGYLKPLDVYFSQLLSLVIVDIISYTQISLMEVRLVTSKPMVQMALIQAVFAAIWVFLGNSVYRMMFPPRELLLIYGDYSTESIEEKFNSRADKYVIVNKIHIDDENILSEVLNPRYRGVVLWDLRVDKRNKLLKYLYGNNIRIYMTPKISDVVIKGSDALHLFDTPLFLTREYNLRVEQAFIKRVIDLVCALLLAIITSPIMLLTALIIKLYDGGPVIYKQTRCTMGNKEFQIMKFRSMKVDAEKDGVARLSTKHDDRITPIGRFIRKVRIDELPQLFNILKGEMSFIGPRPERPEIIAEYLEEIPEFAFRTKVKAGLAGYAQIYGKYNTTPYDKLKLDLSYIENYTIWLDLKLMLLTLKILVTPEATEGIDDDKTIAGR